MRAPCEFIVWHIIPSVRKELARELVETHNLSQAEVARRLDITDAAISQYFKEKRGKSRGMEESGRYAEFRQEIRDAAVRIMGGYDVVEEICSVCRMIQESGMLEEVRSSKGDKSLAD